MKNLLSITFLALILMSFSTTSFFEKQTVTTELNTPEEFDEGYEEGHCEGFKEGMNDPNFNCPGAPYIDNEKYNAGCTDYKCGYNAGFKHGLRDARKYN